MKNSRTVAAKAGFSGEFGMAYTRRTDSEPGTPVVVVAAQDSAGKSRPANQLWRWASVTKQVVAVLIMQEVAAGRIDLDAPVARYLPQFASPNASKMTVRQLLRHQSGLPNPDDTPAGADGVPEFYRPSSTTEPLAYCAGPVRGEPGGNWAYNNCDYIVAAALLETVTGTKWADLVKTRIAAPFSLTTLAAFPADQPTMPGFVATKPEPAYALERFGGAGALYGSMSDLLKFDLALQQGKLVPAPELAQMWDGKPELGSIALGQWSFTAPLNGCSAPVRIIERRGAIGGVQVRNIILPNLGIAAALFTDRAEFEFGEIWQGRGFSYDILSLAACPQGAS
ncbi:MAG: serine hydrolase domain-containing protein [Novosphingobium sp.]|uniref:serine hydrolase domain-containing protein n=1 Tax=Novosphingobium sp. TaxID=1874826 RepID=UPI003C7A974B